MNNDGKVIKSGEWGTCIWGIDQDYRLYIADGVAVSTDGGLDVPWDEFRGRITEATVYGDVKMPEDSSLGGLFKNCTALKAVNLKQLDTSNVTDFSSMFENCTAIEDLELQTFNTDKAVDMSRMFSGCRSLSKLDISSFNTEQTANMYNMFAKCRNLHYLVLGNGFSVIGDGSTDCGKLYIRDTGKYKIAKVIVAGSCRIIYAVNNGTDRIEERMSVSGYNYVVENVMFKAPDPKAVFKGWCSEADGDGEMFEPGTELGIVEEDVVLYAIWVCPPKIGKIQPLREIAYGQPLPLELPEIESPNDNNVTGGLEISSTGDDDSWHDINHDAILPAACNGYFVRLWAKNIAGTSYSAPTIIRIKKAGIDISKVHWVEKSSMTYDGSVKRVWVEGLPEGVTAVYKDNEAVDSGTYSAKIELQYDRDNYSIPVKIKDHTWTINKSEFDMSAVRWDYEEPFYYDGTVKTVKLVGLPEGITADYEGNRSVNAGVLTATAALNYDTKNYLKIPDINPCRWEIKKKTIDVSTLRWSTSEDLVYDGTKKSVRILNLPADAAVEYSGEVESMAGKYLARANIADNYHLTGPAEYAWEIKKAEIDMSDVKWNYDGPYEYRKEEYMVGLENVPEGLEVRYYNRIGIIAGEYDARAVFTPKDPHNYATPEDMILTWEITKRIADMSNVRWDYTGPFIYDGQPKEVRLVGLPDNVYARLENSSATKSGVYTAHAVMKYDEANYVVEQPADCQWQINKVEFDVSDIRWDYSKPFTYDGLEKSIFLINVPDGLNVEYSNNVETNVGKYVASAKLIPTDTANYETPEVNGCAWSISRAVIDRIDIRWSDFENYVYDGTDKTVRIISGLNPNRFNVTYTGNVESKPGRYIATAKFEPVDSNNYEPPEDASFCWTIKKADFDMRNVVWDYNSPFTYDGRKKSVSLLNLPDGLIAHYDNASAIESGNYIAVAHFEVTDSNNYNEVPDMMLNWSVQKGSYDLSEVKWQEKRLFSYDGKEKCIELEGLPAGLTPVYRENTATAVSEHLAMVDFEYDTENYEKPVFGGCRWKIVKSDFDPKGARWNYEEPFIYDGTEKSVSVVDLPDGAVIEYNNENATTAGTYIATADILAEDTANYNHTRIDNLVWRIEKGEYDMSHVYWDYEKPLTFDGKEKRIVLRGLPDGVIAVYRGNSAINAGEYEASVTFKIADSQNYNVPKFDNCRWVINKANHDISSVQWNYSREFVYNGSMYEVTLNGLPDGLRVLYDGNAASNAGTYTAKAILIPYDEENYNAPTVGDCHWSIVKADYDMSQVRWDYEAPKQYNEREQGVALENLPSGILAEYSGNDGVEVGKYVAKARLILVDPMNYNLPSVSDCAWEIVYSDIDMSQIKWNYKEGSFVYDGTEKSIEIENLPDGVTAAYRGNTGIDAGEYLATAEFNVKNKNYRVPESVMFNWNIGKANCNMSGVRWDYVDEFTYDGKLHGINLTGLPSMVVVDYENNRAVDAGKYEAVATFGTNSANYIAPEGMTCKWTINKANIDISHVRWDYDMPFVYDGEDKEITLAGISSLFEVSYENQRARQAGVYTAHAKLKPVDPNNYNVPVIGDCDWEIVKINYDMSSARWVNDGPFIYDGTVKGVHLEGLPEGVTPIYTDNTGIDVGTYYAEATFEYDAVNFTEPRIGGCKWRIDKTYYDMTAVRWTYDQPFKYDEKVKLVQLEGLPAGLIPKYTGNEQVESGTYRADVEFEYDDLNYFKPRFDGLKWEIEKGDLKVNFDEIRWSYSEPFVYDGEKKGISLVSRADKSNFLSRILGKSSAVGLVGVPENVDAEYEDNEHVEAGIYFAKATLRHKTDSNYNEMAVPDCRWEIRKAQPDMSNVKWDYSRPYIYDGEEKSVELVGLPEMLTVSYENNVASVSGTYDAQAKFELKDSDNYEMPLPVKGCWWQIDKADYDMSLARWEYDDNLIYSGKEKMVKLIGLPEGVSVYKYVGNTATEAGSYTAEVQFRLKDPDNYNDPEILPLRWRIQKKKIDTDSMYWSYNSDSLFVYDGQVKEVKLVGVPKDAEVVYVNNSKVNAGSYVARARLTYDTKNYELDEIPDCEWTIEKANIDTSKVFWDYRKPFTYDGQDKVVSLKNVPNQIEVRYRDNRASAIGLYTAKAYLTYNSENYNPPAIETRLDWEIVRKSETSGEAEGEEALLINEFFAQDE